jgi:selenocysteine lyase/cysteine desulfurase
MIYFDNAATTFPKPQCVYDAVQEGMKKYSFNSGRGSYKEAKDTYKMIEETREKIAKLVDTDRNKVIFTSSATESINNIVYGLNLLESDTVFVSPFEHNAIFRTLHNVGVNIEIIPFDCNTWILDIEKYRNAIVYKKPKAVIISHISNVTGYLLPYQDIFEISKKYNCINILDSAQAFGIII